MNVAWRGHELWTAGRDGTLKQWEIQPGSAKLIRTTTETGAFRLFHLFANGWAANVAEHFVLIEHNNLPERLRLDLDKQLDHIDVSPNGDTVVASTDGEVFVFDLAHHRLSSFHIPSGSTGYVGFINKDQLALSLEGGLFTINLSTLYYINFR
jgi:hypothetical protein